MYALPAAADPQPALDAAKARWAQQGLQDYRFAVQRSCFCPSTYTRRYRIDVVGGKAFDAPRWVDDIDTVPKLFAVVQRQIDGDGELSVTYDDATGMPTSIGADPIPEAVDDEFGITAGALAKGSDHPRPVDDDIEDGTAEQRLTEARARWQEAGLRRYRYRLRRLCFCPPSRARTVIVRDGREPKLFRVVGRAIRGRVSRLDVQYGKTGFPRTVSVDPSAFVFDEEQTYRASRLRPLP